MANWTVSSYSAGEAQGDNVNAGSMPAYADLTITPDVGYVISATDFKIGGATESPTNTWTGGNVDSEIYKVVFSDNSTAATVTNTVNVRVYFDSTALGGTPWSMPGNDDILYIDIDEKGEIENRQRYFCIRSHHFARTDGNGVNKHTVTYATAPTGITTTNNTPLIHNLGDGQVDHLHSGTVPQGQSSQIFQVTFATNTIYGYYYNSPPVTTIVTGQYAPYYQVVDSNLTYTSMTTGGVTSNELTAITYTVYYTPPIGVTGLDPDPASSASAMCELGQIIEFDDVIRQEDQGEPGSKLQVTSVSIDQSNILSSGELRGLWVYGDPGASFVIVVTDSDGDTYDFPGNANVVSPDTFTAAYTTSYDPQIMFAIGYGHSPIHFPAITSDTTYDITIIPNAGTSTAVGVPTLAGDLRLYQYTEAVVTLGIDDSASVYDDGEFPTAITLTGEAGRTLSKGVKKSFSYTIQDSMVTSIGSDHVVAKTLPDFTLDNVSNTTTLAKGAPSSATFDVDSTTGIKAGNTINWSIQKLPLFDNDATTTIIVGAYDSTLATKDQTPGSDVKELVVGMKLSSPHIEGVVKITAISGGEISLDTEIRIDQVTPITFTSTGITVSSVTDTDTLVASQSLEGLSDNISLSFGGGTSDVSAYVVDGKVTQSEEGVVVLSGALIIDSFPTANTTIKMDINKLISIE